MKKPITTIRFFFTVALLIVLGSSSLAQTPGGTTQTTRIWLKANSGTTPSAGVGTLTSWTNFGTSGAVTVNGAPTFNQTGYNFNPKTHFNGNGNFLSHTGVTSGSVFAVVELENLTRVYTHLVTWQNMCGGPNADGTLHGGMNAGLAAFELSGYAPEFEAAGVWRRNGIAATINTNYTSNHEIVSAVANSGDMDQYSDRLLGGQPCLPERDWLGDVSEVIVLATPATATEREQIESYLAIKYGLTLGTNGTSKNYLATNGTLVWTQATNAGYNWDITGISRDDATSQDQRKSHTEMWTGAVRNDILTIANGANFSTPSAFTANRSFFIWGHNNGALINTNSLVNYNTDNGEVIETIFARRWKSQESGTVNTVTLEFDMNNVVGTGATTGTNDLANLRLLVDEDGDFSDGGATSISPSSYNNTSNIAYFQLDFVPPSGPESTQNRGFFFTLGSTDYTTTPLPVEFSNFNAQCLTNKTTLTWETQSEVNADYFEIESTRDGVNFTKVGSVDCAGTVNSTSYYTFDIDKSVEMEYIRLSQYDVDGARHDLGMFPVSCTEETIKVYPNPSNEKLNISAQGFGIVQLVICDLAGRIIMDLKEIDLNVLQTIDVQMLTNGIYTIVIDENGKNHVIKFSKN